MKGILLPDEVEVDSFRVFFKGVEPRLREALSATLGSEAGREAAADALSYGWENWERVQAMDNPAGYLYVVGRDRGRKHRAGRRRPAFIPVDDQRSPWVEPDLPDALSALPEQQRRVRGVTLDGTNREYTDVAVGRPPDVAAIDGGFVGWDSQDARTQRPSVSIDGVRWTPIVEVGTGASLPPGGHLHFGGRRAIYLQTAPTSPPALWEITAEGAIPIETAGTPLASLGSGRDGEAGTMTVGDAGIAYLTGFLHNGVGGVGQPSEIVTSTDGQSWLVEQLPASMIGDRVSLAIGSDGIVATVTDFQAGTVSLWNRELAAP